MLITPVVLRPRTLYRPFVLRQLQKGGCLYFHSIEPVKNTRGAELQYSYYKKAETVANNAVNKINVIV